MIEAPLHLRPRISRGLCLYLLALHGLSVLTVACLPLAPVVAAALIGATLGHGAWVGWTQTLRRAPWSIVALSWNADDWQLTRADGRIRTARLLPSSVVTHPLLVLHFADAARRRCAVPLCRDSFAAEDWRRLQARLRLLGARSRTGSPS